MKQDTSLFMAYEYATAVGMPVSEVIKLPLAEYTTGFMAYQKLKLEMIESNAH